MLKVIDKEYGSLFYFLTDVDLKLKVIEDNTNIKKFIDDIKEEIACERYGWVEVHNIIDKKAKEHFNIKQKTTSIEFRGEK